MFVVCPSCAGPFRLPADQIAPLVQIACPHCEFRMILDFEAANDPSLVESGHLMAQGFENIEQYSSVYSHVTSQPDVQPRQVEAPVKPVEAVKPVEVRPEPTRAPPTTPTPQPVSQQPQARPLARPTSEPTPQPTPVSAAQTGRGSKTIIQTPKKVASIEGMPALEPRPKAPSGPTMRAGGRNSEMVTEPAVSAVEAKVTAVEPGETPSRLPPHTPPAATAVSNAPTTPEPATTTRPEDIAAQSGSHPSRPEKAAEPVTKAEPTKEPTRPAGEGEKKPPVPQPTGGSNTLYIIIVLVVVLAAIAAIYLGTRS
jgi:hypothetical protein